MWSLVAGLLRLLGYGIWICRPARLDFDGAETMVSVNDDTASVIMRATINCGVIRWWGRKTIQITLPEGLKTEPVLRLSNLSAHATTSDLNEIDVVLSVHDLTKELGRKWKKNSIIQIEAVVPCRAQSMLEFVTGESGERTMLEGGGYSTRFLIRKRREYGRIVIRQVTWKLNVTPFIPIQRVVVRKNAEENKGMRVDHGRSIGTVLSVGELAITEKGKIIGSSGRQIPSELAELSFPLSFKNADDEYEITFETGVGRGKKDA